MLTMKDIIRDGHPTLREKAKELSFLFLKKIKKLYALCESFN